MSAGDNPDGAHGVDPTVTQPGTVRRREAQSIEHGLIQTLLDANMQAVENGSNTVAVLRGLEARTASMEASQAAHRTETALTSERIQAVEERLSGMHRTLREVLNDRKVAAESKVKVFEALLNPQTLVIIGSIVTSTLAAIAGQSLIGGGP